VTINGAQAGVNPVTTTRGGESVVTGSGLPPPTFTIQAANVTLDGFSVNNPGQSTGILIKTAGDNALIANNIIERVGGAAFASNTQAIYLENGPDGVRIVDNRISQIVGVATSNGGVFIGDSAATNASRNTLIQGNSISDVQSVSRGAYAVHVNNRAGASNLQVGDNIIRNLNGGGWVHAVGLESDTPGVVVTNNSISLLTSPTPDIIAVWFEANPSYATGSVNENNFDVTIAAYGIAVLPTIPGTASVDGECNWWGDPNGPGPVGAGAGA
jgi:hypothetical protein